MIQPLGKTLQLKTARVLPKPKPRAKSRTAAKGDEFSKTGKADPDVSERLRQVREQSFSKSPDVVKITRVDAVREKYGLTGKGVGVAVIDSGFSHPEYQPAVWVDIAANNSRPVDENGHGTHCTGDLLNLAPQAKIIAVRDRSDFPIKTSNVVKALQWAVNNREKAGIKIISLSQSVLPYFEKYASHPYIVPNSYGNPVMQAVKEAVDAGLTVVVGAGNSGPEKKGLNRLAEVPGVIVAGSVKDEKQVSDFSSRGPALFGKGELDVLAPGEMVVSLAAPNPILSGNFVAQSGTSFSTPEVAGIAALMYEADPQLTNAQVKQILKATARPIKGYGKDAQGAGLVDAEAALDRVYQLKNRRRIR